MNKNANAYGQVIKNGKQLYTEISINATPAKVWAVLTNFSAYPSWNPFIKSFKGKPMVGEPIEVLLQPEGSKGMTMKPEVLNYEPNKELRWIGQLFASHIFDGEHAFVLRDNGDGTTTFMQYEHFRGILVPLLKQMLDVDTKASFMKMNEALKRRVELAN
jgi:hypothetical protein